MNDVNNQDDWFAGPEPEERRTPDRARHEVAEEDWLQEARQAPRPWFETIDRRLVVLAAIGVALLIAVLAAAGVFSSSPKSPSLGTTTTPATPGTTTTQTPTTARTTPLPAPTSTLKPGDTGSEVTVLQRALASLGFSTGPIDGQYGPATVAAVKRFQRSVKLTPDGIAGRATLTALATALRGP